MYISAEKITNGDLGIIGNSIKVICSEAKTEAISKIRKDDSLTPKQAEKKEMEIEETYDVNNNPIYIAYKEIANISDKVDAKKSLDKLGKLIEKTENKKATEVIWKIQDKMQDEIGRKMHSNAKSKIEQIDNNPAMLHGKPMLRVREEGENVFIGNSGMYMPNGYKNVFLKTLENEMKRMRKNDYTYDENPKETLSFVKDELANIKNVEKLWETQEFKKYIEKMYKENPNEARKFHNGQNKKIDAIRELNSLYKKIADGKEKCQNLELAIQELENRKNDLPKNEYNKMKKSLFVQKQKNDKKISKAQSKEMKILEKSGLNYSINHAKQFFKISKFIESETINENNNEYLKNLDKKIDKVKGDLDEELRKNDLTNPHEATEKDFEMVGGEPLETRKEYSEHVYVSPEVQRLKEYIYTLKREKEDIIMSMERREKEKERENAQKLKIIENEVDTTIKKPKNLALPETTNVMVSKADDGQDGHKRYMDELSNGVEINEKYANKVANENRQMEINNKQKESEGR